LIDLGCGLQLPGFPSEGFAFASVRKFFSLLLCGLGLLMPLLFNRLLGAHESLPLSGRACDEIDGRLTILGSAKFRDRNIKNGIVERGNRITGNRFVETVPIQMALPQGDLGATPQAPGSFLLAMGRHETASLCPDT
jgi:hypothetical protein